MDELAQTAMDAVTNGSVKIVPERYAKGYLDWLGEKRDWPIGRQLWWGHRIPVWTHVCDTQEEQDLWKREFQRDPLFSKGRLAYAINPIDDNAAEIQICAVDDDAATDYARRIEAEILPGGNERQFPEWRQSDDVLDTWFSSALWPSPHSAGRPKRRNSRSSIPPARW